MFCQSCGNSIIESLSYCNRCGARVTNAALELVESKAPTEKPTSILITILIVTGLVVLTGLGLLVPLLIMLAGIGAERIIFGVFFFYMLTLFGISFSLLHQFSKVFNVYLHGSDVPKKQKKKDEQQPPRPAQLFERNTAQIEAPQEPFISVTEHTTRVLDPLYQERK